MSYAIVTGLGGTLTAASREGRGTTLTVVLPAAPPLDASQGLPESG